MKEGWIYKKLGELYPIVMGKTPPRGIAKYWDTMKETHNLWVSIGDLSKNEGKEIYDTKEYISNEAIGNITKISKGSLLVSFKLTLGKMAFAGDDLYTNEAIMSLCKREDIDLKFLYYYFSSLDWGKLAAGNEKVKGKTLNKKSLSEIPVAYIPLSEQQRIVARLDSAFAHIEEVKANAEKQLRNAQALFQKALTKAMEPKEGWEEKKLSDVSKITHGKNQKEVLSENGKYPIYGSGCTIMGYATDYLCEANTTILGRKGSINNPQFITERFWNVDTAFGISAKEGNDSKFVYYFIKSVDWSKKNTGTTLPSLTQQVVGNVPLFVPSPSEQQRIVARLDSLSAHVRELEEIQKKIIAECDALKQALLRKVFE